MRRRKARKAPQRFLRLPKPLTDCPATIAILVICVLIQVLIELVPEAMNWLCMGPGQPWGLLTYQFSHVSWNHLMGNFMFGLPFMAALEHAIGSRRLTIWYLLCGGGSAVFFGLIMGFDQGLIGASGSISGMMMAACLTHGKAPLDRIVAFCLGMTFLTMQVMMAMELSGIIPVAYWGHVGGMVTAILLFMGDMWEKPLLRR